MTKWSDFLSPYRPIALQSYRLPQLSSLFTLHLSDPSPEFVSSQKLTNKFYPLPQGARELFCSKPFTRSTFQPFNSLHTSRFTLHFDKNLSPYRLAVLSPSSTLLTLHPSLLTLIRTYRLIALQPRALNFDITKRPRVKRSFLYIHY